MTEWTFSFWQMLVLLFLTYYIGNFRGIYEGIKHERKKHVVEEEDIHQFPVVKITVETGKGQWYAFNEEDKMFLAQSDSYEGLQEALSKRNPFATYIVNTVMLEKAMKEAEDADTL